VILRAKHVVQLQYFLMDTAKRYGLSSGGGGATPDERLASAAGLDYVLFVCSQYGDAAIPLDAPVAASARETLGRAAKAALDFCERMLLAPDVSFTDFAGRYACHDGIFQALRGLHDDGALSSDELQFRTLTLAHDVAARRRGVR
jgi:hypothetical protein